MSVPSDRELDATTNDKAMPYVVYVLYLVGLLGGGPALLIGVVIAYLARRRVTDPLLLSHYAWQIQIFWWTLLCYAIALVVSISFVPLEPGFSSIGMMIGIFVSVVIVSIILIVLVIRGLLDLSKNKLARAHHNPAG